MRLEHSSPTARLAFPQSRSTPPTRPRHAESPHGGERILDFWSPDEAFTLSTDGNGGYNTGWLEKQTVATIGDSALAGTYMVGPLPLTTEAANAKVGEYTLKAAPPSRPGYSTAGPGVFAYDQTENLSYLLASTTDGAFTISNGTGGYAGCIAISSLPIKIACTLQERPGPSRVPVAAVINAPHNPGALPSRRGLCFVRRA